MKSKPGKPAIPDCINCASVGLKTRAVMQFVMPTPKGEKEFPLCKRHFDLLYQELTDVHNQQNPKPKIIVPQRPLRMN